MPNLRSHATITLMKPSLENLRHARSSKDFPDLDLAPDEYVELLVKRSRLGLVLIWAGEIAGFLALTALLILLNTNSPMLGSHDSRAFLNLVVIILYGVLAITGIIGTYVYNRNYIVVTNKRAIQNTTITPLTHSVNIIDLQSIEDVSFRQNGIVDYVLRTGTVRLSTVGDETTYTLSFVDTPNDEIKVITRLVQAAKDKRRPRPPKE